MKLTRVQINSLVLGSFVFIGGVLGIIYTDGCLASACFGGIVGAMTTAIGTANGND